MKKFLLVAALVVSTPSLAKESSEKFREGERNFRAAMQKILEQHLDKGVTEEDLYRAATAGMLSSLNPGDEKWNKLLSPQEVRDLHEELSGKVSGVGINMKFEEETGYARVLSVIPGTPAARAGIKTDDQILSVDGKRFKGQEFKDLVAAVRGETGKPVGLKVLRDDSLLDIKLTRKVISWSPVTYEKLSDGPGLLTIDFFNEETPRLVSEAIERINEQKNKKLVIDMRENSGGGFEQAIRTAGFFLPKGAVIVSAQDRSGHVDKRESSGSALNTDVQIVLLTDKHTSCGAELFVGALKENRNLKVVGEKTFGKWNAQSIETLPNAFAIKYTVREFKSPLGNSYQGVGIQPDIPVGRPDGFDVKEIRAKNSLEKRLGVDTQLKAAIELARAI